MSGNPEAASAPARTLVLVDASVWIQFFRAEHSPQAATLDALLSAGPVAICAPIRAEVVSGARTQQRFQQLNALFDALIDLNPPADVWSQVTTNRFALARRGHQISLVDLLIAVTAAAHRVPLWTLDEDFQQIAHVLPLMFYRPAS